VHSSSRWQMLSVPPWFYFKQYNKKYYNDMSQNVTMQLRVRYVIQIQIRNSQNYTACKRKVFSQVFSQKQRSDSSRTRFVTCFQTLDPFNLARQVDCVNGAPFPLAERMFVTRSWYQTSFHSVQCPQLKPLALRLSQ
jgi:hypothetical protein